jgi:sec-independent protein translocase protein TatA
MRLPQGFEWLIILLLVVLLFGAKRLPDAARGVGRSLRIFKAETKGMADDATAESTPAPPAVQAPPPAPAVGAAPAAADPAPQQAAPPQAAPAPAPAPAPAEAPPAAPQQAAAPAPQPAAQPERADS